MFNIKEMMQQAQQMQFKMQELQEKFKDIDVQAQSGDGLVTVRMSCAGVVRMIDIHPSLAEGGNKEAIEEYVMQAFNNANTLKDAKIAEETEAMMQGMNLGGKKLPF